MQGHFRMTDGGCWICLVKTRKGVWEWEIFTGDESNPIALPYRNQKGGFRWENFERGRPVSARSSEPPATTPPVRSPRHHPGQHEPRPRTQAHAPSHTDRATTRRAEAMPATAGTPHPKHAGKIRRFEYSKHVTAGRNPCDCYESPDSDPDSLPVSVIATA